MKTEKTFSDKLVSILSDHVNSYDMESVLEEILNLVSTEFDMSGFIGFKE